MVTFENSVTHAHVGEERFRMDTLFVDLLGFLGAASPSCIEMININIKTWKITDIIILRITQFERIVLWVTSIQLTLNCSYKFANVQ